MNRPGLIEGSSSRSYGDHMRFGLMLFIPAAAALSVAFTAIALMLAGRLDLRSPWTALGGLVDAWAVAVAWLPLTLMFLRGLNNAIGWPNSYSSYARRDALRVMASVLALINLAIVVFGRVAEGSMAGHMAFWCDVLESVGIVAPGGHSSLHDWFCAIIAIVIAVLVTRQGEEP